ncbi:hypothetical protein B0H11DRAFT_2207196 [Mycena galericulata]|nr:hypothetical protein B0H11DRAFT_2207196 [Mycena galericulata]
MFFYVVEHSLVSEAAPTPELCLWHRLRYSSSTLLTLGKALLIWDHCITLGLEVRRIWSRKLSGSTVLYACLRYGTLFEKITVLLLASWYLTPHGYGSPSRTVVFWLTYFSCDIAVRVQILPMIVRTIGYGMFSSLRVLALSERNWYLAILVFLLCLPSAIMPAYVYAHQDSPAVNINGLRISGIIADVLSEIIVITVTVNRTFGLRKNEIPLFGKKRPSLALLLLRDADMLVLIPEFATRYDYWVVPYYTPVFRTILICRFLTMLRAVYYDEGADADKPVVDHSIRFASQVIGPMGAPVDTALFDDGNDMEDEESVYAEDPLVAGLAMMSESDAPAAPEEDQVVVLKEINFRAEVEGEIV